MATARGVTTFNVNQFDSIAHAEADLRARMATSDVLLLQESVRLDLNTWVKTQPGWAVFQVRNGINDGHANTAVLYRTSLGAPTDTAMVPLGRHNTRERFLVAVKLGGVWFGSFHGFPLRDAVANPALLKAVGAWVAQASGIIVLGCDKNQIPVGRLVAATGLKWFAADLLEGIDGFLANVFLANVTEFPKGFSDHPGVHADATIPEAPVSQPPPRKSHLQKARAELTAALKNAEAHGRTKRAALLRKLLAALTPKSKKPAPPPVPTAPHGFMPGAVIKNIPPGSNDPGIIPVGVIQHIAVSDSPSLFGLFSNDGGIESHFYVRKDGTIEQYRSIYFEADAQFAGNSFGAPRKGFVSVEHQGGVGADLGQPMPQAQLDAFHRVVSWVHAKTGFPLRVCPAWNEGGVGYHALFTQWNTNAHSCPGPARIKQFNEVTVPWMKGGGL